MLFNKQHEKGSFLFEVQKDFNEIKNIPDNDKCTVAHKKIIDILKSIIGKNRELTLEESLLLLQESKKIPKDIYEELKKKLIRISYLKYGNHNYGFDCSFMEDFFSTIYKITEINKEENEKMLEIYLKIKQEEITKNDEDKSNLIKMHKKELIESEKKIVEEIKKEYEEKKLKIKNIKDKQETINEIKEKNIDDLRPENDMIEEIDINEISSESFDSEFKEIFEVATGFKLSKLINFNFNNDEWLHTVWDLGIKFCLIAGKSEKEILNKYEKNSVGEEFIKKIIKENSMYLENIKDYSNLNKTIKGILYLTVSILEGNNFEEDQEELIKKGFSKEEVEYISKNLFPEI